MKTDKTGGVAFPVITTHRVYGGMTLRDYFAAKALTGLLAHPEAEGPAKEFASTAYILSDAMIAERAR